MGFFNFKEKGTTYKTVVVEKKYIYWVIVQNDNKIQTCVETNSLDD